MLTLYENEQCTLTHLYEICSVSVHTCARYLMPDNHSAHMFTWSNDTTQRAAERGSITEHITQMPKLSNRYYNGGWKGSNLMRV